MSSLTKASLLPLALLASLGLTTAGVSAQEAGSSFDEDALAPFMSDPGTIGDRLDEPQPNRAALFRGFTEGLAPWYDFKATLDEEYGLDFGVSFTTLYQNASGTFGPEDDASGFDLDISGVWTIAGRQTDSPTRLGFQFFYRDKLGTELPPQVLFTQFGGLYSSAGPYGETGPTIGQFYLQQRVGDSFGFQVGRMFPIVAYNFFPFKNFRTDFVDFNHATNAAIPLPDYGLGAFVRYKPTESIRFTAGVHDANADAERTGFNTLDGEYFTYGEIGFDTGLEPRVPGRPPPGYVHLSAWHQDERSDAGVEDGWGLGLSAVQRFGRFTPFARFGYADVDALGPTPVRLMANAGLAVDEIFGQTSDRIAVGYTWSDPSNRNLDDQHTIDAYYRVQLTPEIQIGPIVQVIFDPVNNADEDTVVVGGFRTRLSF